MTKESMLSRVWRQLTGDWTVFVEETVPGAELAANMHQSSIPSLSFFFMLGLAVVIATLGLIGNSAPTIIGAMIVAPLMSPITSFSFGMVIFDRVLISRSLITVMAGVILVVAMAYLITLMFGMRITGSEILNRTHPSLIDLGVAVAAGGAAAFAHTRKSIMNSIAGVAIAVALVPPLAVSGIGLALGHKATTEAGLSLSRFGLHHGGADIAGGSFLLFVTNFIGIVTCAMLVFLCQRYGNWNKALLALVVFLGLSGLLIQPLNQELRDLYVKNRVVRQLAKLARTRPDIVSGRVKIDSINVVRRDGLLHVNIEGFFPIDEYGAHSVVQEYKQRTDLFRKVLEEDIGSPVVMTIDAIPVNMTHFISQPPELEAEGNQGAAEQANPSGAADQ